MIVRALMASLCLIFSQVTFAGDMPDKPANCPSASALKSGGFFMAQKDQEGHGYVAFSIGSYQTPDMWGFALGFIQASNEIEALMKANELLPSLKGNPKPMPVEQAKTWACLYGVNGPYQVVAFSPLPQQANYPHLIKTVK